MAQDAIDRAVAEGSLKADACSTAHLKLIGSGECCIVAAGLQLATGRPKAGACCEMHRKSLALMSGVCPVWLGCWAVAWAHAGPA